MDTVLVLDIDYEVLEDRVTGRRVHIESGRTYHVQNNPPVIEGLDDITGEPLA